MFTGIITDMGKIGSVSQSHGMRVRIETAYKTSGIDIGSSIACDGVCLTVVATSDDSFEAEVSQETLDKTTLGDWCEGRRVNLERALKVGDELGGHIVSGHVDGVATVTELRDDGESTRFIIRAPDALARFIAPKGSVTLNGTSLTVNEVNGTDFGVNIIPHTKAVTTWGRIRVGDRINIEIDTLARYVARLVEATHNH